MSDSQQLPRALRAYQTSSAHRTARQQEADVFMRANGALKAARDAGPVMRVRALADNRRLWLMIMDLVRDPENALPEELKGSIVSVALAVQREMQSDAPSWDFLIGINENIAAGLSQGAA